jgi:type IV secretion system protein VirB8
MARKEKGASGSRKDEYVAEARSWETDRMTRDRRAVRIAFAVAAIAAVIALAEALALTAMTPLKQTVPYLVRVNNSTGVTDLVTAVEGIESLPAREALSRYWITQYVQAREGYFFPTVRDDYRKVVLWSAASAKSSFANYMNPERNQQSPVVLYRDRLQVDVSIKSISFLDKGVASVRFTKRSQRENEPAATSEWIASINFKYLPQKSMSESARRINPLGFTVGRYRVNAETPGATDE